MDLSIEDHERGYVMKFNIFKPSQQMPPVPAVGQPVVLRLVKVSIMTISRSAVLTDFRLASMVRQSTCSATGLARSHIFHPISQTGLLPLPTISQTLAIPL